MCEEESEVKGWSSIMEIQTTPPKIEKLLRENTGILFGALEITKNQLESLSLVASGEGRNIG